MPSRASIWQLTRSTQDERLFDAYGRIVRYRLGNAIRDLRYDAADRITAYTHYDAVTGAATPSLDQSFGYDELGRLTNIAATSSNWSIAYDANGNRTSVAQGGSTSNYVTPASSNRITRTTNPLRLYTHDSAGNVTDNGSFSAAGYDLSGRLSTLTRLGKTASYGYDAFGRRVRKFDTSGAASTVIFVYDLQDRLLGEYDSAGAALREYVWLGAMPIAVFTPAVLPAAAPRVYYVHADHLQAPRAVTDIDGKLRWLWLAEPFGTTAPNTNPQGLGAFTFPLRLPGQYADAESGLNDNYFRSYDPSTGRFIQSDPIGLAGGINTYAYADGSPTSRTDPLGLATFQCTRKLDNFPFRVGPLYHQYVCTGNAKDGHSCRGLGPTGSMFDSPGKLEPDVYKPEACEMVDDDSQCIERCIAKRFASSVPNYSVDLSRGDNCQTYARAVVGECEASCRSRRK